MKRSTLDILLLVNKVMDVNRDIEFSVDWVSALAKTSWRTAKNCLETLAELGLITKYQPPGYKTYRFIKPKEDGPQ